MTIFPVCREPRVGLTHRANRAFQGNRERRADHAARVDQEGPEGQEGLGGQENLAGQESPGRQENRGARRVLVNHKAGAILGEDVFVLVRQLNPALCQLQGVFMAVDPGLILRRLEIGPRRCRFIGAKTPRQRPLLANQGCERASRWSSARSSQPTPVPPQSKYSAWTTAPTT